MALRRVFLPRMGQLLRDRQRISRALQDSQVHIHCLSPCTAVEAASPLEAFSIGLHWSGHGVCFA